MNNHETYKKRKDLLVVAEPILSELSKKVNMTNKFVIKKEKDGHTNLVFRARHKDEGLDFIIKVARDARRARNMNNEYKKLCFLESYPSIPTPNVIMFNPKGEDELLPFLALSAIQGINLKEAWEEIKEKHEIATEMGNVLCELHAIQQDFFCDSEGRRIDNWSSYLHKELTRYINLLSSNNLVSNNTISLIFKNIIINSDLFLRELPCIIHKDFQLQNLIVNQVNGGYKLVGVCDFESSFSGPAALEFAIIERFVFGSYPELRIPLLRAYQQKCNMGKEFKKRVEFYNVFQTLRLISRSIRFNEVVRLQNHVNHLERLIAK